MAKITIDINEQNLPIVLNILENLKSGLIKDIDVDIQSKVKPISSSISNKNKYISKEKYKQKIQKEVLEDEFIPKNRSNTKYLSPSDYKKKLIKR